MEVGEGRRMGRENGRGGRKREWERGWGGGRREGNLELTGSGVDTINFYNLFSFHSLIEQSKAWSRDFWSRVNLGASWNIWTYDLSILIKTFNSYFLASYIHFSF